MVVTCAHHHGQTFILFIIIHPNLHHSQPDDVRVYGSVCNATACTPCTPPYMGWGWEGGGGSRKGMGYQSRRYSYCVKQLAPASLLQIASRDVLRCLP